jgi:hypothetical protein
MLLPGVAWFASVEALPELELWPEHFGQLHSRLLHVQLTRCSFFGNSFSVAAP